MAKPEVIGCYHETTGSIAYLVIDPATKHAAIVDPVLDYDEKSGHVWHEAAGALPAAVKQCGLKIDWILDTHPHADRMTMCANEGSG